MGIKDRFTAEEWQQIVQSPMLAGLAVTAADPSGLWGSIKEGAGVARALVEAKTGAPAGSMLADIAATFDTPEGRKLSQEDVKELLKGKKPAEASDAAVARLGAVAAIVEAKAPEHADAYKEFLRETARKVAEASKEGGFMGFGGEAVSDAERNTLADLDAVLG
jgi:hypothetical protein